MAVTDSTDICLAVTEPDIIEANRPDAPHAPQRGVRAATRGGPYGPQWWIIRLIPVVMLAAAAAVLWHEFRTLSLKEVADAIADWGDLTVATTIALAIASFGLMGVIEKLGLRWSGAVLPWRSAMGGSFIANGIAHALGANLLVAGALRLRLYKRHGVRLGQVATTTAFNGMTFAVGLSALSGAGLLLASPADLEATAIPILGERALGLALAAFAAGYILVCAARRRPLTAFGRSLTLPGWRVAILQLFIGMADNAIAAAIIWTLLPDETSYLSFVGAYAIACVAGLMSAIPGGAGVFEGALASLLPGTGDPVLAAALLGYRLFYYILPLLLASVALAIFTVRRRNDP